MTTWRNLFFRPGLIARISTILRRSGAGARAVVKAGGFGWMKSPALKLPNGDRYSLTGTGFGAALYYGRL